MHLSPKRERARVCVCVCVRVSREQPCHYGMLVALYGLQCRLQVLSQCGAVTVIQYRTFTTNYAHRRCSVENRQRRGRPYGDWIVFRSCDSHV
jgi:hypothetical protein